MNDDMKLALEAAREWATSEAGRKVAAETAKAIVKAMAERRARTALDDRALNRPVTL